MLAEVWVWPESVKEDAKNSRIRVEAMVAARVHVIWLIANPWMASPPLRRPNTEMHDDIARYLLRHLGLTMTARLRDADMRDSDRQGRCLQSVCSGEHLACRHSRVFVLSGDVRQHGNWGWRN